MFDTAKITITITPTGAGMYAAQLDGRLLVASTREPLLAAARVLIAEGYPPGALIVMRHAGSGHDALRARLGRAARLTVDEYNGTVFARWKPFPVSAVAPPMRSASDPDTPGYWPNSAKQPAVPSPWHRPQPK